MPLNHLSNAVWKEIHRVSMVFSLTVKPALDGSQFGWFSRNIGKLVVLKAINNQPVRFFFPQITAGGYSPQQWSMYSAGGEGSPCSQPAEHNSAAGGIPPSSLTLLMGKSGNFLFFTPWLKEGKLHYIWPALVKPGQQWSWHVVFVELSPSCGNRTLLRWNKDVFVQRKSWLWSLSHAVCALCNPVAFCKKLLWWSSSAWISCLQTKYKAFHV